MKIKYTLEKADDGYRFEPESGTLNQSFNSVQEGLACIVKLLNQESVTMTSGYNLLADLRALITDDDSIIRLIEDEEVNANIQSRAEMLFELKKLKHEMRLVYLLENAHLLPAFVGCPSCATHGSILGQNLENLVEISSPDDGYAKVKLMDIPDTEKDRLIKEIQDEKDVEWEKHDESDAIMFNMSFVPFGFGSSDHAEC